MLWKLAFKEILHKKIFSCLFLFNLAIGLLGLILIENFKESFQKTLSQKSKDLLGADIALLSRFPLEERKQALINKYFGGVGFSQTNIVTLFSMAKGRGHSYLIYLQALALDQKGQLGYPYYGHLELDGEKKFPTTHKALPGPFEAWAYPEVVRQLNSRKLRLGREHFKIVSLVTDDSQQGFEVRPIAPKIFISLKDAKAAGLIQKGSTLRYRTLIKTSTLITKQLVDQLVLELDDNSIEVRTPDKSSQQVGRVLSYLSDFLGLISLAAFFLASVGLFYLYRSHLGRKRSLFSIYASLGLEKKRIFGLYLRHIFLLSLGGLVLGFVMSVLLIPLINVLLSHFFPFSAGLSWRASLIALIVGVGGVLLLCYPLILLAIRERPASLFQEVAEMNQGKVLKVWKHFIPYGIFFSLMSFYVSQSFKVGGVFLLLFLGVGFVSLFLGLGLLKLFGRYFSFGLKTKLSFRYLSRYWASTISLFVGLLLGAMLLSFIPMLEDAMTHELKMGRENSLPSLFLFDIQDEQVDPLKTFFKEKHNLDLLTLSPLIRARMIKINDRLVKVDTSKALTREEQRRRRFQNRGINLSVRNVLSESETILKGRPFLGAWEGEGLPLLSVEVRYAKRMGIELGDQLEFDILGLPVKGQVHNIRRVRWISFLPNFFIQFQRGVLDNAPKTWLAAIPALEKERLPIIQEQLFEFFPNVSALNITRMVDKILSMMSQIGWAFKVMSLLCLVVGLFVLYSLSSHQMQERRGDMILLKVIGMDLSEIRKMTVREFVFLTVVATSLGVVFGMLTSFLVANLFFDGLWIFSLKWPLLILFGVTLLCYGTSFLATREILKMRLSFVME